VNRQSHRAAPDWLGERMVPWAMAASGLVLGFAIVLGLV
jgi:hypothetical protein